MSGGKGLLCQWILYYIPQNAPWSALSLRGPRRRRRRQSDPFGLGSLGSLVRWLVYKCKRRQQQRRRRPRGGRRRRVHFLGDSRQTTTTALRGYNSPMVIIIAIVIIRRQRGNWLAQLHGLEHRARSLSRSLSVHGRDGDGPREFANDTLSRATVAAMFPPRRRLPPVAGRPASRQILYVVRRLQSTCSLTTPGDVFLLVCASLLT